LDTSDPFTVRINYKILPAERDSPFGRARYWLPIVKARLASGGRAVWVESIVDSGSHCCVFHSDVAAYLGIDLKAGRRDRVRGVMATEWSDVFYHPVTLSIGSEQIQTVVGFVEQPSTPGLLGRIGFFENFHLAFDPIGLSLEILPVEKHSA
jgi:hypothetical protein